MLLFLLFGFQFDRYDLFVEGMGLNIALNEVSMLPGSLLNGLAMSELVIVVESAFAMGESVSKTAYILG